MQNALDTFYQQKEEPTRSCLAALRDIILSHKEITATLKYGMPCFCHKGKAVCYLWVHKKYQQPYILLVEGRRIEHPQLLIEKRSRMKIMLFDPGKDLPIRSIRAILKQAISLSQDERIREKKTRTEK